MCSCAVRVTIFGNGSIIPTGFEFTELQALPLTAHSYALLCSTLLGHTRPTMFYIPQVDSLTSLVSAESKLVIKVTNTDKPCSTTQEMNGMYKIVQDEWSSK